MTRRKRPSMVQARNQTGDGSRHTPLDQKTAPKRATAWVKWIQDGHQMASRDEMRIQEAFGLAADKNKTDSYAGAVQQAYALGGKELTVILALAVGKSALRDTRKELKQKLPAILAEKGWHLSTHIRQFVRQFEGRLLSKDNNDYDDFSKTVSVITTTSTSSDEPKALVPSGPTPSQQAAVSYTSHWQYRTELTGTVYELTPTDLLELSTGLVAQQLSCPGPLLLMEPFRALVNPFITVPITSELCLYLRSRGRKVM